MKFFFLSFFPVDINRDVLHREEETQIIRTVTSLLHQNGQSKYFEGGKLKRINRFPVFLAEQPPLPKKKVMNPFAPLLGYSPV